MKNLILTIALLTLGIVSCSSCAKKDTTPDAAPIPTATVAPVPSTPPVPVITASIGNVSIIIPSSDWKKLESEGTLVGYVNMAFKNAIVLGREPFDGTRDAYILQTLRSIKDTGSVVVSTKQVTINGHNFVLFESTKTGGQLWSWVTMESGYGIALTCGGLLEFPQQDRCFDVASSLKIN